MTNKCSLAKIQTSICPLLTLVGDLVVSLAACDLVSYRSWFFSVPLFSIFAPSQNNKNAFLFFNLNIIFLFLLLAVLVAAFLIRNTRIISTLLHFDLWERETKCSRRQIRPLIRWQKPGIGWVRTFRSLHFIRVRSYI